MKCNTINRHSMYPLLTGILISLTLSGLAQESGVNWMREYVRLRVHEVTVRNLGFEQAQKSGMLALRPRIVGGEIAGPQDNPFQVALLASWISDNYTAFICGGTLIKSNVVVTAAHCSEFISDPRLVQVLTATRKLDGTGMRHNVSRVVIHPHYNPRNLQNDVAVWTLASDVHGIKPAKLATNDGSVGEDLLVTGWGEMLTGDPRPIDLAACRGSTRRTC